MYSLIFTQAARAKLIDAQDWYEGEVAGLGRRFRQAIDAVIERMSDNPRQFPTVFKNVRRAPLRRFPPVFTPVAIRLTGRSGLEMPFHKG